jgi:tRNA G26 N,N-dimethylase Trm1
MFIEKSREKGFDVIRSHYHKRGIKTNASIFELIKELQEMH